MAANNNSKDEIVYITAERLAELEALEASIPTKIQEAIDTYKKSTLMKLHQYDKDHPESVQLRMKKYYGKNREIINKKRREKRADIQQISTVCGITVRNETLTVDFNA